MEIIKSNNVILLSWKQFWSCELPERVLGISGIPGRYFENHWPRPLKWYAYLDDLKLKAQRSLEGKERREKDFGNTAQKMSLSVIIHFFFLNRDNVNSSFLLLKAIPSLY